MALLGRKTKDPVGELERELATLHGRGELLRQKLIEAQSALESATDARRISLLDADLSDEESCRRRDQLVRDARDRVESLTDAAHEIATKVANAQLELVAARDRVEREQIAAAIRADADALAGAAVAFSNAGGSVLPLMDASLPQPPRQYCRGSPSTGLFAG